MPKLRIKDLRPRVGDRKKLLWNRLMNLNLLIYSIKEPSRNIFIIITSDEIVDRLLTTKIKESLKKDDFEVLTPPEYNAKRTFVLRNLDSLISTVDPEELKNDLEVRNSWLKVTEVIKLPNAPKILKIKAECSEMVKTATEKGVLIYNQSVPPHNIEREIFVYLNPCYHCYKYDHATDECRTPNITLCSECAATNHTYRECQTNTKKCLNCQEPHRTLAARCPVRRRLIKEKSKEMRDRTRSRSRARQEQQQQPTYAQAAGNNRQSQQTEQMGTINREDQVKVQSSIQYAYMVEGVLPGTFHATVAEMYHINGLPPVKFPAYIPPPVINAENIQEEIRKMKNSYTTTRQENRNEQGERMEMDTESRKRTLDTPSPQAENNPPKTKRKENNRETEEEIDLETLGASAQSSNPTPQSTSQGRSDNEEIIEFQTLRPSDIEDEQEETEVTNKKEEESRMRRKKFEKHVADMKFCFVRTAETEIKKGDLQEITQLIKAGKMKYVYSNPIYKESDCRVIWEKGHVNISQVDIRTISKEGYNNIHYNGKLIVERRSNERKISTSSQTSTRRK